VPRVPGPGAGDGLPAAAAAGRRGQALRGRGAALEHAGAAAAGHHAWLPGSGKTFASQQLLERTGAIRLRSDVERKRLHGLAPLADSRAAGRDLYTPESTQQTYARLFLLARRLLCAGWPVVLDAAFLRRVEREQAHALAAELQVPFAILDCDAPPESLRQRLAARTGDASEADLRVLELLRSGREPLQEDERAWVQPLPE
jgi:predicted kinase